MDALEISRTINWSLFFLALAAAGIAGGWVGYVALGLLRRGLEIERELSPLLDGLAKRSDTILANAESAAEDFARIETAALRLEESLGRLSVLVGAFSEVNRRWKNLTDFVR
jgi:hypothetical protein